METKTNMKTNANAEMEKDMKTSKNNAAEKNSHRVAASYTASGRGADMVRDFCPGWKFGGRNLSAKEASGADYDDSGWETVNIPHTWNAQDAEDGDGSYVRAVHWYRKTLKWDEDFSGKKIYLEFLGANQKTSLYVNENPVPLGRNSNDNILCGSIPHDHLPNNDVLYSDVSENNISHDDTSYGSISHNDPPHDNISCARDSKNSTERCYTHKGGYTAFRYDVTDFLTHGTNLLAVCVDNSHDEEIAPISADFNMYGGIYRRVFLIVADEVHIDLNNHGSSGLFLTAPNVRSLTRPDDLGALTVAAKILNESENARTVTVTAKIIGDNAPAPVSGVVTIPAGQAYDFRKDMKVENPHLWNGICYPRAGKNAEINHTKQDIGYRYTVCLTIQDGEKILDSVRDFVGFRYFFVDKEKGFFLNGKPHPLRGVNRHQFRAGLGNALTEEMHDEDMEIIKEMGVNIIRLCHYPHTEYFYDLCDENGMVIWSEIPFVNALGTAEKFADVTKEQLTELILQQYNRPSICFWGLENEVGSGNGDTRSPYTHMKLLEQELDALAHTLDPSGRYTVQAINQDQAMDQNNPSVLENARAGFGWKSDLMAWNIYPCWYPDPNFTGNFAQVMNRKAAQESRPMGLSEYGWGANAVQHELYPVLNQNGLSAGGPWHPEEYQSLMHEQAVDYINHHDSLWCTCVWAMFDFAVDARREGSQKALNDKGLVTGDRKIKKDSFYLYKANYNQTEAFVHITSARYAVRESTETYVKVYSNCDYVELFVGSECLGAMDKKGNGIFLTEAVLLSAGENRIRVVGRRDGDTAEYGDECVWRVKQPENEK